jgi:hypothetical protein
MRNCRRIAVSEAKLDTGTPSHVQCLHTHTFRIGEAQSTAGRGLGGLRHTPIIAHLRQSSRILSRHLSCRIGRRCPLCPSTRGDDGGDVSGGISYRLPGGIYAGARERKKRRRCPRGRAATALIVSLSGDLVAGSGDPQIVKAARPARRPADRHRQEARRRRLSCCLAEPA